MADRYRLERELGRGGMATVFLAHDLRHNRPVALKVLHPELAQTLGPERFQREIETVARLQHPHILTVHDSGETAGQLWFTMPFVEGESLRDRLRREQQLPVEVALRIATDAARALQYAHEHGVIHRDIKPENLLLTKDGSTLVADFGIARALSAGDDRLTETGISVGTPTYMSPEQAAGERTLDARTDVYALGAVLYEMLAGEPPFTGPTAQAVIAKRFSGEVPRVRHVRPSVPESVEQAVTQALAPVAADRFATTAEFARALAAPSLPAPATAPLPASPTSMRRRPRRLLPAAVAGAGLLLLAGTGLVLWQDNEQARLPGTDATGPTRLAVLPFENLGDSADAYFADGVTDEVRGKLATLPALQVIARSSSTPYHTTTKSPKQIGRELGVEYLLTATVRWDRGGGTSRVRVSPELVQVATASTKWQKSFDAPLTDVFRVQADIAGRVAQALDVALGAGERERLAERPTQNLSAYDAFLRAEEAAGGVATSDPVALRRARDDYERAVALDSTFALAWAQLSRAHSNLYFYLASTTPAEAKQALGAAERALALAPTQPEGYLALGDYYGLVRNEPMLALEQYARGRQLAPRDARLLTASAVRELDLGRAEEALAHLRDAEVLDPRSVESARWLVHALLGLRHYSEALTAADRALALAPADLSVIHDRAVVYLALGDLAGARGVLRAAAREADPAALGAYMAVRGDLYWVLDDEQQRLLLRLSPAPFADSRADWGFALAETHALRGNTAMARAYADSARLALEAQLRGAPENAVLHAVLGVVLGYLGRRAEAIREGERGVGLAPITKGLGTAGYVRLQLARIYLLVGEPERALDQLEPMLKRPFPFLYLSPGWLKIDPTFATLRGNPRFERLLNGT